MPMQLTPDQERRIQSFVDSGLFSSATDVVDAALVAVEQQTVAGFEGTQEELDALLLEGLNSGEPIQADDAFWSRLRAETERMAVDHEARKRRS